MSERTITKTFYVGDSLLEDLKSDNTIMTNKCIFTSKSEYHPTLNEIQISWKVPEREVTLSESQFNKAIEESRCNEIINLDTLREKLFGELK